jgi:hypothetical protein
MINPEIFRDLVGWSYAMAMAVIPLKSRDAA